MAVGKGICLYWCFVSLRIYVYRVTVRRERERGGGREKRICINTQYQFLHTSDFVLVNSRDDESRKTLIEREEEDVEKKGKRHPRLCPMQKTKQNTTLNSCLSSSIYYFRCMFCLLWEKKHFVHELEHGIKKKKNTRTHAHMMMINAATTQIKIDKNTQL